MGSHYALCYNAESHYARCHYAEWHYNIIVQVAFNKSSLLQTIQK
jgi:hypothetical protein